MTEFIEINLKYKKRNILIEYMI